MRGLRVVVPGRGGAGDLDGVRKEGLIPTLLVPSQEGANINKSLTTLGKVISALADLVRAGAGGGGSGPRGRGAGLTPPLYSPAIEEAEVGFYPLQGLRAHMAAQGELG